MAFQSLLSILKFCASTKIFWYVPHWKQKCFIFHRAPRGRGNLRAKDDWKGQVPGGPWRFSSGVRMQSWGQPPSTNHVVPSNSHHQAQSRLPGNLTNKDFLPWFLITFVYIWKCSRSIIWTNPAFQIFYYDTDNKATLVIKEVFPEDAGTFTCVAKNCVGYASSSAELMVEHPLSGMTHFFCLLFLG